MLVATVAGLSGTPLRHLMAAVLCAPGTVVASTLYRWAGWVRRDGSARDPRDDAGRWALALVTAAGVALGGWHVWMFASGFAA